jgi:hypothetical protein
MAIRTLTAGLYDTARISSIQKKFGSTSLLVPSDLSGGVGCARGADAVVGATYTVECWIRIATVNTANNFIFAPLVTNTGIAISVSNTGQLRIWFNGSVQLTFTASIGSATWYHIAVTASYNGGTGLTTVTGWKDGTQVGTGTFTGVGTFTAASFVVGRGSTINNDSFNGYIDEFRLSNNLRYTTGSGFTPSTVPFTDDANTRTLFHFESANTSVNVIDDDGTDTAFSRYPLSSQLVNTANYARSTAQVKFGTNSHRSTTSASTPGAIQIRTQGRNNNLNSSNVTALGFSLEFWFYPSPAVSLGGSNLLYIFGNSTTSATEGIRLRGDGFLFTVIGGISLSGSQGGSWAMNTWYHYALEFKPGAGLAQFLNGTRIGSVVSTDTINIDTFFFGALIASSNNGWAGGTGFLYLDDIRITKGAQRYNHSNFTAPTTAYVNDAWAVALYNAEAGSNTVLSDSNATLVQTGAVTVTAEFAQTAAAQLVKNATINIASEFTSSASGNIVVIGQTSLDSNFTVEAQSNVVKNASATLDTEFTQTTIGTRVFQGASLSFGQFDQTASATVTKNAIGNFTAEFSQTATAELIKRGAVTVNAEFAQTATGRILKISSAVLSSQFTLASSSKVNLIASATLSSAFAIDANSGGIDFGSAVLSSQFTLASTSKVDLIASATLSAEFNSTTLARKVNRGASLSFGQFALTSGSRVIHSAQSQLSSEFVLSADADVQSAAQANITANFNLFSTSKVTHRAASTLATAFTISAYYRGQREGDYFVIDSETRIGNVLPETRIGYINGETRQFNILKETREATVASEVRTLVV